MKSSFTPLVDDFLVYGQVTPEDVIVAAEVGVTLIINNRPDGEEPGQPSGAEIEAAAQAAGIGYVDIPVGPAGLSFEQLDAFAAARAAHPGKALGYCKSGMRSTIVWALVAARAGQSLDTIIAAAADAGYEIAGHRPMLESLQER